MSALVDCIPSIQAWIRTFYNPQSGQGPPAAAEVDTGFGSPIQLRVLNVHSVEDKIWSTMWGVKGIVDATVDVSAREQAPQPSGMQK